MSETIELLPCPFCGGPAHTTPGISQANMAALVMCSENDCAHSAGATLDEAVKRWNTRTPAPDAVREALESAEKCVPTNWCDELLSGPKAPRGDLKAPDVERLLRGVIDRIRAVKAVLSPKPAGPMRSGGAAIEQVHQIDTISDRTSGGKPAGDG